jgi:hypothetical protein
MNHAGKALFVEPWISRLAPTACSKTSGCNPFLKPELSANLLLKQRQPKPPYPCRVYEG